MQNTNFVFILGNIAFESDTIPFSISENILIRAATNKEKETFKSDLGRIYGNFFAIADVPNLWVLKFTQDVDLYNLAKIACLVNPKMYFELNLKYTEPNEHGISVMANSTRDRSVIQNIFYTHIPGEANQIPLRELNKFKTYYSGLTKFNETSQRGLDMFFSASNLPIDSELLTLSLFSIIESLITHKPRSAETLDSITHQIKNKIKLLSKRFDYSVKHEDYFGNIEFIKLLEKLYALRSAIAHGQKYCFSKNGYLVLKNIENVNKFLDEIVREIIKLSINDAQLIEDIKEC